MKPLLSLLLILVLAACARGPGATPVAPAMPAQEIAAAQPATAASTVAPKSADSLPLMLVHRDPDCGCCEAWAKHMREAGFTVEIRDEPAMDKVKRQLGIPDDKASCHTAEVGGYVIEGHVPAEDIKRLLAEHPKARGLALPGMPVGSPGMGEGQPHPAYTVELLATDGKAKPYAVHPAQ